MWYEIECVGIEKKINQRFRNDYTTAEADVDLEAEEEDDDEAKDGLKTQTRYFTFSKDDAFVAKYQDMDGSCKMKQHETPWPRNNLQHHPGMNQAPVKLLEYQISAVIAGIKAIDGVHIVIDAETNDTTTLATEQTVTLELCYVRGNMKALIYAFQAINPYRVALLSKLTDPISWFQIKKNKHHEDPVSKQWYLLESTPNRLKYVVYLFGVASNDHIRLAFIENHTKLAITSFVANKGRLIPVTVNLDLPSEPDFADAKVDTTFEEDTGIYMLDITGFTIQPSD